MADEITNEGQQPSPPAGAQNSENRVPQSRFNEVLAERNAAHEKMAELQRQMEEIRTAQLTEKEDFRKLYEETKSSLEQVQPKAAQVDEWRAALSETAQAQIDRLPEDARGLVPDYDDPRKTLQWLNKNAATLTRAPAPNMHAGPRGDDIPPDVQLTAMEEMIQKRSGIPRDVWIKHRQAREQQQREPEPDFLTQLRNMNQE
jgi:hypothetical protein